MSVQLGNANEQSGFAMEGGQLGKSVRLGAMNSQAKFYASASSRPSAKFIVAEYSI